MITTELKPGMLVAVYSGGWDSGPSAIREIERVTKRFVELSDGSKWTHHGSTYPRGGGWGRAHIKVATPEHEHELERKRCLARVRAWTREGMDKAPIETLRAVAEIVDPVPKATP